MVADRRGFRRVVSSPRPVEIVELKVLECLLELGVVVVAAGGGGIPVQREGRVLRGVDAVVDKDYSAALLADRLGADTLVILTSVPAVFRGFETDRAQAIGRVTAGELRRIAGKEAFAPGSMGPKVEAVIEFVNQRDRRAIICDPGSLGRALVGEAGTVVVSDEEGHA